MQSNWESFNNAFKDACKRVEITNLRLHDFKRKFATQHLEGGSPIDIVKRLGGWKSTNNLDQRNAIPFNDFEEKICRQFT